MSPSPIPFLLERTVAVVFFTLSGLLVALHTVFAWRAAQRAQLPRRGTVVVPASIALFLACWLALALATNDSLPQAPRELQLPVALLVGYGPMLAAIALLFFSRSLRALGDAMPPAWPIWAQTYRLAGFVFLFPFLAYGVVPAAFAVPAALGDMITGALAPAVGRAVARGRPDALRWAFLWNLFGVVDLIVAPASAIASHANVIGHYPLAIVPLFLGPPMGILVHIFSLRNLAAGARAASSRDAGAPSPALGTI